MGLASGPYEINAGRWDKSRLLTDHQNSGEKDR